MREINMSNETTEINDYHLYMDPIHGLRTAMEICIISDGYEDANLTEAVKKAEAAISNLKLDLDIIIANRRRLLTSYGYSATEINSLDHLQMRDAVRACRRRDVFKDSDQQ